MVKNAHPSIRIDLNEFKLHIYLKKGTELTLHFNSPSRMFYLSVIALVVNEMKQLRKITSIPLERHLDLLVLLNESVGGSAGSSDSKNLLIRIYRKWKNALPNLEEAPLYKVLGRKKEYDEGIGKTYIFTEAEKDSWANLFEYKGSEENVRLKFSIDKIGASLDDVVISYEDALNGNAWERFLSSLKGQVESVPEMAASKEKMAFPLPDKPSIAVMPFLNMTGDQSQEFLGDGFGETLVTALSKVTQLFVIARESTRSYKGKAVKVNQVAEDLGVQYVLEGSVQKAGDRVRVTAQLIDALKGHHLWADNYDRSVKDFFGLQDEVIMKILTELRVKITEGEAARIHAKETNNLMAYLKVLEAGGYRNQANKGALAVSARLCKEAMGLDPNYAMPYVDLARVHVVEVMTGASESPSETLFNAMKLAQRGIELDNSSAEAHSVLGIVYLMMREHDKAIEVGQQAVKIDPNCPLALNHLATSLNWSLRSEEALPLARQAIRLNPLYSMHYAVFGIACRETGKYDEGIAAVEKSLRIAPNSIISHVVLVSSYIYAGREDEARAAVEEIRRIDPNFSPERFIKGIPMKEGPRRDRWIDSLRQAGLT